MGYSGFGAFPYISGPCAELRHWENTSRRNYELECLHINVNWRSLFFGYVGSKNLLRASGQFQFYSIRYYYIQFELFAQWPCDLEEDMYADAGNHKQTRTKAHGEVGGFLGSQYTPIGSPVFIFTLKSATHRCQFDFAIHILAMCIAS